MEHNFPKWFYHKEIKPDGKIVHSEQEYAALGEGWEETPAAFDQKSNEAPEESEGTEVKGSKNPDIKEVDLTKMTNKELCDALIKNGVEEKVLKGKKKDELIAMLGALA